MTYTIVRDVPAPTIADLGREPGCCVDCRSLEDNTTLVMPEGARDGLEALTELAIGDALDGPASERNVLGQTRKAYDDLNRTKHEIYMLDDTTVRCRRMR